MAENYSHQNSLFDPRLARPVVVIGVGAIGSWVCLALAKMGVHDITVVDGDVVDSHNAPMSLYQGKDIGRLKVDVLREVIEGLTGMVIKTVPLFYTDQPLRNTTVIACVDTMAARNVIWQQVRGQFTIDQFIETRTVAAYSEVYAVSPRLTDEQVRYETFLYPDSEANRQNCGSHGVIFASLGVVKTVVSTVARFWQTGQKKFCHAEKHDTLEIINL